MTKYATRPPGRLRSLQETWIRHATLSSEPHGEVVRTLRRGAFSTWPPVVIESSLLPGGTQATVAAQNRLLAFHFFFMFSH